MNKHYCWLSLFAFWILSIHTLFSAPLITNFTPFVAPSSGGTGVLLTGSGFTGATQVAFGEIAAANFNVNSDTSIFVITPPHSPETVLVTVTGPSGTSPITHEAYFVYQGNGEAYVANATTASVSAINTATNATKGSPITVGNFPSAIGITPNGTKVYVANQDSNTVSVIDTASHIVIATIPVGDSPCGLAITPDGTEVYVTNQVDDNVSVINTATNSVVATIPVGSDPIPIAITPNGKKGYVGNNFPDNTVSVIDIDSHTVDTTFPVVNEPFAIAITPDGTKVFVINLFGKSVSIIRTSDNTVVSLTAFNVPVGVAIMSDGTYAYVTDQDDQTVSVINVASNTIVAIIPVLPDADTPHGIGITPNGEKAFTANQFNTVSIINTITNTVQKTITIPGNSPTSVAITPDGTKAYVASTGENIVWVIDTATNMVEAMITVESTPAIISIAADQAPLAKFTFTIAPNGFLSTFNASASVSPVGTIENYFWDFGDGNTFNTPHPITSHIYTVPGNYIVSLIVTNSAGTSTTQILNPASATILTGPFERALKLFSNTTTIINNGGPSALLEQMITVFPPPLITQVNSNLGSTCGGTIVSITGTNFMNATGVFFGQIPATRFTINSDTSITVIAPPGASGTVDIRVVVPGGISAITPEDQFIYSLPSAPKHLKGRQITMCRCGRPLNIINILTWKIPSKTCPPFAYRIYRDRALTKLAGTIENQRHLRFKDPHRKLGKTYTYYIVSVDEFGDVSEPAKIVIKGRCLL